MSANTDDLTGRLDRIRDTLVALIDDEIAADRKLYLAAYFAGHDAEAEVHVFEVDRLVSLRQVIERETAR